MLAKSVIVLSLLVSAGHQAAQPAPILLTVDEAASRGLIELVLAGKGGSSGDVVTLTVKRTARRPMHLRLLAGTVLRSASTSVQNMIVAAVKGELMDGDRYRPAETIDLADDKPRTYLLEAYCLDFDRDNPGASDRFSVGPVNESVLSLIREAQKDAPSIAVTQAAVWLAAGVSKASIRERFTIGDTDLLLAEIAVALWKTP